MVVWSLLLVVWDLKLVKRGGLNLVKGVAPCREKACLLHCTTGLWWKEPIKIKSECIHKYITKACTFTKEEKSCAGQISVQKDCFGKTFPIATRESARHFQIFWKAELKGCVSSKRLQYETHTATDYQEIATDLVAFCKYVTGILVVFPTPKWCTTNHKNNQQSIGFIWSCCVQWHMGEPAICPLGTWVSICWLEALMLSHILPICLLCTFEI